MGFATRLREATARAHESAEAEGALNALLATDDVAEFRTLHIALLTQLVFVYEALEHAADTWRADPLVTPFAHVALTRLPALHADLDHLGAPFADAVALPSVARYVERLQTAARASAAQFVAHHYTRYLGDLSGGLFIGHRVRTTLALEGPDGARFFAFEGLVPGPFKTAYRQALDDAPFDDLDQQRLIDEVLVAYGLNTALQIEVLQSVRAAA